MSIMFQSAIRSLLSVVKWQLLIKLLKAYTSCYQASFVAIIHSFICTDNSHQLAINDITFTFYLIINTGCCFFYETTFKHNQHNEVYSGIQCLYNLSLFKSFKNSNHFKDDSRSILVGLYILIYGLFPQYLIRAKARVSVDRHLSKGGV